MRWFLIVPIVACAEVSAFVTFLFYQDLPVSFFIPFVLVVIVQGALLIESHTYAVGPTWIRRGFRAIDLDDLRAVGLARGTLVLEDSRTRLHIPIDVLRADLELRDPIDAAIGRSEIAEVPEEALDLFEELSLAAA